MVLLAIQTEEGWLCWNCEHHGNGKRANEIVAVVAMAAIMVAIVVMIATIVVMTLLTIVVMTLLAEEGTAGRAACAGVVEHRHWYASLTACLPIFTCLCNLAMIEYNYLYNTTTYRSQLLIS